MIRQPPLTALASSPGARAPYTIRVGSVMFPPDTSVPGATVGAAHPAALSEEPTMAQNTTFRTSIKQDTLADHGGVPQPGIQRTPELG